MGGNSVPGRTANVNKPLLKTLWHRCAGAGMHDMRLLHLHTAQLHLTKNLALCSSKSNLPATAQRRLSTSSTDAMGLFHDCTVLEGIIINESSTSLPGVHQEALFGFSI